MTVIQSYLICINYFSVQAIRGITSMMSKLKKRPTLQSSALPHYKACSLLLQHMWQTSAEIKWTRWLHYTTAFEANATWCASHEYFRLSFQQATSSYAPNLKPQAVTTSQVYFDYPCSTVI